MSIADQKYKALIRDILENGKWDYGGNVRPTYKDGTPSHSQSVFGVQIKFEKGEIPVVTSKRTPVKGSINEVVHWFFRLKSNDVKLAEEMKIGYWKEWMKKNGTIGRSYGHQLKKQKEKMDVGKFFKRRLDQVDAILWRLENDPYSRRIMFAYWNPADVHQKSLQECAWAGEFNVREGQLDFILKQRSLDVLLGCPSNWAGYYALQCAFANLFDYEVGTFTHQIGNAHLYDNQIEKAKYLLEQSEYDQPEIYVNPSVKNFYDYGLGDIKYVNYQCGESIRTDPAI
ncbi:thymidylate synthase [Halobacillus litoralis]|uniref:thymidylate synthase n=1 Tax=Halobacillus litoralis TaxID=45668 RepID=UPI001CD29B32|nr:thymidylate synthase [Halobacillus litoralis]MCA1021471.1 thymidylate synthase [Halobacillus litoralis]